MSSTTHFKYSILEGSTEPIDYFAPVSFLVWYQQQNFSDTDINRTFLDYKKYVIDWCAYKKKTDKEKIDIVRDSYIQLLREIVVNYSTEEEKRFVTNANFTDPLDLDIILPFFIKKIKSICLYYANARDEVKTAPIQFNLKGSNLGVEKLVKKVIFDAVTTNQVSYSTNTLNFPPVSAVAAGLSIYVEELYDLADTYYNLNPNADFNLYPSDTTRKQLSSSNLNEIYPELYIDFRNAIKDAILTYPFFISTLGTNNFTINPIISGTELYYLKPRDFINYLSGGEDQLKINLLKKLAPKYLGNDFYYLSTNATNTTYVSGVLFSVKTEGAPTLNLLNREYPSTATVPNLNYLYTQYEIGSFFLPQHTGLLIHNTKDKTFELDTTKLEPDTVYAFPDPSIIGNTSYNSRTDNNLSPFIYKINLIWNKKSRSNQFAFGDVLSDSYNQLYYGYESVSQDLQIEPSGISKTIDNIEFWGGEKQEIWTESQLWPGLNKVETLPLTDRQQSLMVGSTTPIYWGSDIYGNELGLYKNVNALKQLSSIDATNGSEIAFDDAGAVYGSQTVGLCSFYSENKSIFDKKYKEVGSLYFRNNHLGYVSPASAALSAVFYKYPSFVRDELYNKVVYFGLYYDTVVIETSNYVVVDVINFDYDINQVVSSNTGGIYFSKYINSSTLECFAGEWYSEVNNTLYLAFMRVLPSLSGSNYRLVYPEIYRTPLTQINLKLIYPFKLKTTLDASSYSLSGGFIDPPQINLFEIDSISFSKSEKTSLFNLTYLAKNLNKIPFIVNEQLKEGDWDIYLETFNPKLFKPYYFVYDNNSYNSTLPFLVKYNASSSGIVAGHNSSKGKLTIGNEDNITYIYNNGVFDTKIDKQGIYIIQFDWESYDFTSIFVGCSSFYIKNIDDTLIFNALTPSSTVLNKFDVPTIFAEDTITTAINGVTGLSKITATVTRPVYPDPSILKVTITSTPDCADTPICSGGSITRQVYVTTTGSGSGVVFSDPSCLLCGNVCVYDFPLNSTVSLIASANNLSKFVQWHGGPCEGSPLRQCSVTLTDSQILSAEFEALPFYRLIVDTVPGGRTVTNDLKIDCPIKCQADYLIASNITLSTINPVSGWYFTGWKGGPCQDIISENICAFQMSENYTISAHFIPSVDYDITVTNAILTAGIVNYGRVTSIPAGIDANSNETKTATFTGAKIPLYDSPYSTVLILCAKPSPGYQFKEWVNLPEDTIITNNLARFRVNDTRSISAIFDIGYYTLNLNFSGDGAGYVYNDDWNIYAEANNPATTFTYRFLSGSSFTLYMSAYPTNTIMGVSSQFTQLGLYTSAIDVRMDSDKTIITTISARELIPLEIIRVDSLCGVISSIPPGLPNGLNCGENGPYCSQLYARGSTVTLYTSAETTTCRISAIINNGEDWITYPYSGGTGINFSEPSTNLKPTNQLSLIDNSIILDPAGAPYTGGSGITVLNGDVYISMTNSRTVTASFYIQ